MPNVTMQKVASIAGVSMKTVSRVVNKENGVKPETRKKVLEVIKQLEYQPNPAARGLAAAKSFLVALLYDNPSKSYITRLQDGVLDACRKHGYGLLIHPCQSNADDVLQNINTMARQSRVDGLVLTPPLCDNEDLLDMLDERGLKYVRISPLEHNDRSPVVYADECDAAYRMTQYLISQGHTRIGFITGHPNRSGTEMRIKGYRAAMDDAALQIDPLLMIPGKYTFDSGEAAARKLLRMENRPTAIFACNDYMAAGVMKVAHQMKIRVPYELSVNGYDNSSLSHHIWPRLTTVSHPVEEVARQAASILIKELGGESTTFEPDSIHSELVIRESTGPLIEV
jgi:LacI family transcriptional regulator